jgi:hypothetical protein
VDKPTKLSMKLNIKESTKIEEKKNIKKFQSKRMKTFY